jgi:SAM-dependent methyltransferase
MPSEEVLDPTCGNRSIWYPGQKDRNDVLYVDTREAESDDLELPTNPNYSVEPDEVADFRELSYPDESFNLIVFDPPHAVRPDGMKKLTGITTKKYGCLHAETWQEDLRAGFLELFRVLKPGGTLVFKFADESADFTEVLELAPAQPMFGTSVNDGRVETRWFVFYKPDRDGRESGGSDD